MRCCFNYLRDSSAAYVAGEEEEQVLIKRGDASFAATVDLREVYKFWTSDFLFVASYETNELRNTGKSF